MIGIPLPFFRSPSWALQLLLQPMRKTETGDGQPPAEARAKRGSKSAAKKVGLKPAKGWHKRNFLTQVLIPSLFTRRLGNHLEALFPDLKDPEIGVTWIGHASFFIQTHGVNLLIDPNWAKWMKVIKRLKHPGLRLH